MLNNEKLISEACHGIDEKQIHQFHDKRMKTILSVKGPVVFLLKEILPEIFSEMSREEILTECIDPINPDPQFMNRLTKIDKTGIKEINLKHDLLFKIRYPKWWIQKNSIKGHDGFYLLNIEPQSNYQSRYLEMIRSVLYLADLYLNENQFLFDKSKYNHSEESIKECRISTTTSFYRNALPVIAVWISMDPEKERRNSVFLQKLTNYQKIDQHYLPCEDLKEMSLLSCYYINLGPEGSAQKDSFFDILRNLLEGEIETVQKLNRDFQFKIPKQVVLEVEEDSTMIERIRREEREKVLAEMAVLQKQHKKDLAEMAALQKQYKEALIQKLIRLMDTGSEIE